MKEKRDGLGGNGTRFSVHFTVSGGGLDTEKLLREAPPRRDADVWQSGSPRPSGRLAKTGGIRVNVAEAGSAEDILAAIEEFLEAEDGFLEGAARHRSDGVRLVLSCGVFVGPVVPVSISLPTSMLRTLGAMNIEWAVTGYPCTNVDEGE